MNVLVVDDSAMIRDRLVEILSVVEGVDRVDTADGVSQAWQVLQTVKPDVMVLDIHMPGGSGLELLKALGNGERRVMTIVLTNDPAPQWRAASIRAGAQFFFDKSADFQQVVDVIARLAIGHTRSESPDSESLEKAPRRSHDLESLGRLASGVAHDFNNLLTVINGESDLLLRQLSEDNPMKESVAAIRGAGARGAEITLRLLMASRAQSVDQLPIDLDRLLIENRSLLERLAGEEIKIQMSLGAPGQILADPGQVYQVIMNLVVNAREAMPRGGQIAIATSNVDPGPYIRLTVGDTGQGIPAGIQERIFEPFFTTKTVKESAGLGLSIVNDIVRQIHGTITVRSAPGDGAVFAIHFPRIEAAAPAASSTLVTPVVNEQDLKTKPHPHTILIVDDEDGVRRFLARVLTAAGYHVTVAEHGGRALDLARHSRFDAVVTDLVMPEWEGINLIRILGREYPKLKIVAMSGAFGGQFLPMAQKFGANVILAKPFSPEELTTAVRDALTSE